MSKDNLQHLRARYSEARAELINLENVGPKLESEIASLTAELHGLDGATLLGLNRENQESALKLTRLNTLKSQLELLPGCIVRVKDRITKLEGEGSELIEKGLWNIQQEALSRLDHLYADHVTTVNRVCGKDSERVKSVMSALLINSDAQQWRERVRASIPKTLPFLHQLNFFEAILEAFQSGNFCVEAERRAWDRRQTDEASTAAEGAS
jgi:hypothetical protein